MKVASDGLLLHVEHVVNVFGKGAVVSLPIVISDSRPLLRALLDGLGFDDDAPMQWGLGGWLEPFSAWQETYFSRAAGWRLRERLHTAVGSGWRWQHPWRTREFGTTMGSSGRVDIPIERLWWARYPAGPSLADVQWFREFSYRRDFGVWNDGFIAIDLSSVRRLDEAQTPSFGPDMVERLLADPDIWGVIGRREGFFELRLRGSAADLADPRRSLHVHWRSLRYRRHVAEVTAAAPARTSHTSP